HWRFSSAKCRSVLIEGSATFTIAMSSTTMNCAATITASASHLRAPSCRVIEGSVIYCSNKSWTRSTIAHMNAWRRYTSRCERHRTPDREVCGRRRTAQGAALEHDLPAETARLLRQGPLARRLRGHRAQPVSLRGAGAARGGSARDPGGHRGCAGLRPK